MFCAVAPVNQALAINRSHTPLHSPSALTRFNPRTEETDLAWNSLAFKALFFSDNFSKTELPKKRRK
jgi:hypothetical protein